MYQRYGGGNMDEGWTRLMFEQFNVPFKSIMDAEIKGGALCANLRRHRAAGRFGAGHDRRAPAGGAGAPDRADAAAAPGGSRYHAARSIAAASAPRACRRSRPSCRRAARSSPSARPAICRFSASACRSATSLRACRRRSSGRRDRRCACASTTRNPIAYGMPAEGLALFMAGRPGLRSDVHDQQPGRRASSPPTSSATSCRAAGCWASR